MLGATLFQYRNKHNNHNLQGSIALYICLDGGVYVNGLNNTEYQHICSDGERIRVTIDMVAGTIGWERTYPTHLSIITLPIPENIL
jgi:hypothetical protein